MSKSHFTSQSEDYCGTSYASRLLGLSIGTVQALVEKGELDAWKTQGGHRRILLSSLRNYQLRHNLSTPLRSIQNHELLRVLVIDDDELTRIMLKTTLERWDMEIDVHAYDSAVDALLDLASWRPQLILTDLRMPLMNGFEFLKSVNKHPFYRDIAIVAMSGLSLVEVHAQGGLPDGVQYIQKPIDTEWLHGFVDALRVLRQIKTHSGSPQK
jgi:excisionase family DNA binding protein